MENINQVNQLMTNAELAEYLNVKTDTLKQWRIEKKIPYIKMIGGVRYLLSDINEWLKNQTVSTSK